MLHHRANLRKVAGLLLLVWMFALGSSMAHACGLVSYGAAHGHHGQGAAIAADHHAGIQFHEDDQSEEPGKASCVKFCADGKAVSSAPGVGGDVSTPGLPASIPSVRIHGEPLVVELIAARTRAPVDRSALPIAIEYLRLAL